MQSQSNPSESLADGRGRRVVGWVRRSWRAILADLEPVDCGSLDVLLYCSDDLLVHGEAPLRRIDRVRDA